MNACISKHVSKSLEWNQSIITCEAYDFIHDENSKEPPFFLMSSNNPLVPLNTLLTA